MSVNDIPRAAAGSSHNSSIAPHSQSQTPNQLPGYYTGLQQPLQPSHQVTRIPTPQTSPAPGQPQPPQGQPPQAFPPLSNQLPPPQSQGQQPQSQTGQNPGQPYYAVNYPPGAWQNAWQMAGYPYASGSAPYQQHYSQVPYTQYQSQQYMSQFQHYNQPKHKPKPVQKPRTPSPSPPPVELHKHWDDVIKSFLKKVGFLQALRGFEDDMVILNPDWERKKVPHAIGDLMRDLMNLAKEKDYEDDQDSKEEEPLEKRKLNYIHLSTEEEPSSQTSVNKSISRFLAQNRARNDASNRAEFVESLEQKRRRLNPEAEASHGVAAPTCARTDAKEIDRGLQMKYDIAKNEDGPLRRTIKAAKEPTATETMHNHSLAGAPPEGLLSERYPALDERLKNVEAHLAVRYVPAEPRTLLSRLNFLEDHIIQLEKEYPPWAALHFNQPHRGWPAPPRITPIIVPSHITASTKSFETSAPIPTFEGTINPAALLDTPLKGRQKGKSSLHRAVMERLEVQKAISDFARKGDGS